MTRLRNDFFSLLIFGISLACPAFCFNERDVRYKGPSEVWEGDPFEISCILTLRDLKGWTVNGTLVTEDNAGGYVLNERPVDAFRMEVVLGARAAQLHHEGAYRCNRFSRDAHYLNVIPAFADTAIEEESPTRKSTNDYILEINKTVEFFCSSAKDDDVPVMWFKNGALIKESLKSNIIIAGLNLIIENAQEDDAGEYMCTVDTSKVAGYTYIGRIFHLNSPPRIVNFPKKTSIIHGQDLKIICKAKGYPVPKFTWFIGNLNATKLKETDPRIFIDTDNTKKSVLVVERMSFADRGLYTCRAENSLDSGSTIEYDEESVFVHVRDNVIETNEDQLGMGKVLILEQDLVLQCNTTNCPHCVISWSKDGETLYPIPDHIKIHEANQSITIENASYDDSGVYVCSVDFMPLDSTELLPDHLQCKQKSSGSNEYSEEDDELEENVYICQAYNQVKAMHTTIVIDVKKDLIKTNEDIPGVGKVLDPGEPLTLQCNTTDCKLCNVIWFKNGIQVHAIPGRISMHNKNNSMVINSATYNDSGIYVCALDRKHLDVALNATISVQSKIKLDRFDNSAVVTEGSPLEIFCKAKGAPTPLIKWFIGDQEIFEDDDRIKLLDHEGLKKGKLLIEEASYDDRNHYTCEAYNQVDAVNTTVFVRVKGKLAALWPFLGICAEVAILGTIIFVYERKKSMNQCDEPDTALPSDNKHRDQKGKGQDVRQRK